MKLFLIIVILIVVIIKLFRGAVDPVLFTDDNAKPHRVQIGDNLLEEEDDHRINCLSMSLNFNPIEYVWDGVWPL